MSVANLLTTIEPKSDQLNADDLIGRTLTIKVSAVRILGEADQPVGISFEGDNGKPFKPCKSMRRVLVNCWGGDGNQYVGRQMTLYRDPNVKFGGLAVGGIRISHLSNIDREVVMALTESRANRKPYRVLPMGAPEKAAPKTAKKQTSEPPESDAATWATQWRSRIADAKQPHDAPGLAALWKAPDNLRACERIHAENPDLAEEIKSACAAKVRELKAEGATQ